MDDVTLRAAADPDRTSQALYVVIWVTWIIACMRNPDNIPFFVLLVMFANPLVDRRMFGVDVRTQTPVHGRVLHSASRAKSGNVILRKPIRTSRRVSLSVIAMLVLLQALGIIDRKSLDGFPTAHPEIVIGGLLLIGVALVALFVAAMMRGARSRAGTSSDT